MDEGKDTGSSQVGLPIGNLVLHASAGTGKTHRLAIRYLQLVFRGTPADRVLATTFTRKAAGEIFDRVIQRIVDAVHDDQALSRVRDDLDLPSLTRDKCLGQLVELTQQIDRLRISTLDSFFSQMARSFSLELRLPVNWQICDAATDSAMRRRSIQQMLASTKGNDVANLVHLLSQGEADRRVGENMLTAVDECYDIYRASPRSAWKTITRTSRLGAEELAGAIQRLREAPLPEHKKIHEAHEKACQNALDDDWDAFLGSGIARKILEGEAQYHRKDLDPPLVDCYRTLIEQAKAYVREQIANRTEGTFNLADHFDLFYQRQKNQAGLFQFDDVTYRLADMMDSSQNKRIAFRMDGVVDHLLLDEFQDTSLMQWRVLRSLARRVTSRQPTPTSFFCVGDSKQAIYAWRGGRCEIFEGLTKTLDGLQEESMSESFRSAQPIVAAVNDVFQNLTQHKKLNEEPATHRWVNQFPPHSTARSDLHGYVEICTADLNENGKTDKTRTLRRAAQKIAQLDAQSPGLSIGVLTRSRDSASELIFELSRVNVRASEEGGRELTNSASVRLILSLLKLGDHPGDTIAQFHLSTSPLATVLGLVENVTDAESAWQASRKVRSDLIDMGYGPSIKTWSDQLVPYCSQWERRRLNRLIDLAYAYDARATLRGDDFVSFIEHEKVDDPSLANVSVMTIHASKGLQFDIVVLPELDSIGSFSAEPKMASGFDHELVAHNPVCRFPKKEYRELLPQAIQDTVQQEVDRQVYEAICRLYVGMTRAIHGLYVVVAPPQLNEKSLPKSYAGLLRATLLRDVKLQPNQDYAIYGEQDWIEKTGRKKPLATIVESPKQPSLAPLPSPGGATQRDVDVVAPSQSEGGPRVLLADRLELQTQTAFQYGTLIHGWLELIQWLDQDQPTDEKLLGVARRLDVGDINIELAMKQFRSMLSKAETTVILRETAYRATGPKAWPSNLRSEMAAGQHTLDVRNEQSIAALWQGQLISGFIDRLVLLRDGGQILAADIVDFKTDQLASNQVELHEQRTDFYRPQLAAYRQAVSSMLQLGFAAISTRLCFVGPGLVVEIESESG